MGMDMSKLLLLEDDPGLIDGLKYSLERNGFDVTVASSVREASAYLQERNDYALLLT